MRPLRYRHTDLANQRGAALMAMLAIMVMGAAAILVGSLNSSALQIERDKITADALAKAKEGLIAYAATVALTPSGSKRPGDLPCPDTNNDGLQETSCGNASGSTGQTLRIGRLPWKTLGLPDLRDGSGERLWYAVSNNFKYNTRTTCTSPGQAGCLNSDSAGTISVFSAAGALVNNGSGSTGAAAVIIAPGDTLKRQDGVQQARGSAGSNAASNYLDIATAGGITEDNANFTDGSATNGFIQGRIKDSSENVILNDRLLVVTRDHIMQAIQKRVAAEVRLCLNEYASAAQNNGHYPWAAKLAPGGPVSYSDSSNGLFGRIPDNPFDLTVADSDGQMNDTWTGNCNINSASGWWLNWKEMVFYGLADAYKPVDPPLPVAANACTGAGACLSVNPPSAAADKKFVVIVAGKKLPGQTRASNADKGTLGNYLEPPNNGGATTFAQGGYSATFNDTVAFP